MMIYYPIQEIIIITSWPLSINVNPNTEPVCHINSQQKTVCNSCRFQTATQLEATIWPTSSCCICHWRGVSSHNRVLFLPPMSTEATHVQLIRSCQRSQAVRHLFVRLRELGPLFAELSRYLCKSHVWILRSDCISSLVEEPYVAGDWCPGSVSVPQRSRFTFATPCPSSCSLLRHRLGNIYIKVTNKVNKQKIHQKLACLSADILACFNC